MYGTPHLKQRSDVHLARKIWHFVGVLMVAAIYQSVTRQMAIQLLLFFSALFIFVDVYRQKSEALNRFVLNSFSWVMRENEKKHLAGSTFMVVGMLTVVFLFSHSIVILSLLFLAFADPIASYFGIRYGKDRLFGRKSLQGTMAAFIVCTIVAAVYFFANNLMTERLLIVSILAGLSGAIAEVVPVGKLDDNLVLPVMSACLLRLIYYFFGGI